MRESRCMSLLPRTTLHSDSEHVLYCINTSKVKGEPENNKIKINENMK
jgi:hypothetical protein